MNLLKLVFAPICTTLVFLTCSFDEEIESIETIDMELHCTQGISGHFVISDSVSYQKLLSKQSPVPNCIGYQLPAIDFSRHSLIGFIEPAGGCSLPVVNYSVSKSGDKLRMDATIVEDGMCKMSLTARVWCLVPKISKDTEVLFHITK